MLLHRLDEQDDADDPRYGADCAAEQKEKEPVVHPHSLSES